MEHAEIPQNAHNEIIVTEAQPYPNHPGPSHGYDQHVQHGYPPRNNAQMVHTQIVRYPQTQTLQTPPTQVQAQMRPNTLTQRLLQRPVRPKRIPKAKSYKTRRYALPERIEQLRQALDMSKYVEQVEKIIMQPIRIPGTITLGLSKRRRQSTRPKHDLLAVKDVWKDTEQRRSELRQLYNTTNLSNDREFLLNMLLDESDDDSELDEQISEEEFAFMLEHRKEAKKLMKQYHEDYLNTQYQFYSAGILSVKDRHPEVKKNIYSIHEDLMHD